MIGCLQPEKLLGSENGIYPKVATTSGWNGSLPNKATNGLVIDRPMNLLDPLDPAEKSVVAPAGLISS